MTVLDRIDQVGGLVVDRHTVWTSDKHASGYLNVDPLFPDVMACYEISRDLSTPFLGVGVEVVVSVATGGVVWATFTALAMTNSLGRLVKAAWVEKVGNDEVTGTIFDFDRIGFAETVQGKRVLVVDDSMSNPDSRGSAYKVCRLVEQHGGIVIGVSIINNNCRGTPEDLCVPRLESLERYEITTYPPSECPLCAAGVPIITNVGHGKKFQAEHLDYPGGFEEYLPSS